MHYAACFHNEWRIEPLLHVNPLPYNCNVECLQLISYAAQPLGTTDVAFVHSFYYVVAITVMRRPSGGAREHCHFTVRPEGRLHTM